MRLQRLSLFLLPFVSIVSASTADQIVMGSKEELDVPKIRAKPTLSDLLTIEPSASIFYSYARELELSRMFEDTRFNSTLLVPTNKAVMALARKPHQGEGIYVIKNEVEISQEEFDRLSKANVERWISAHIIPKSPIQLDSRHNTLLSGKSVTFKPIPKHNGKGPEWSRVLVDDNIHIIGMKEGMNGVLYLIDGTISTE